MKKFVRKSIYSNLSKDENSLLSGPASWSGKSVHGNKDVVEEVWQTDLKSSMVDFGVTKVRDGCSVMNG